MLTTFAELLLYPDTDQADRIAAYALRYAEAANWLAPRVHQSGISDRVRLHRLYYERLRKEFALPSQSAVLCLKQVARLCRTTQDLPRVAPEGPIPFDHHLFSVKAMDLISLATLDGRVLVPCALTGYGENEVTAANAELSRIASGWIFTLRTDLPGKPALRRNLKREDYMADTLLSRISRLVSGLAHNAIEQAEGIAPAPVMEQAIRDIDLAIGDVRAEIGRHEAGKHNIAGRMSELQEEHDELGARIAIAVRQDREDLAEAGVARQIDIENQLALLERSLKEEDGEIAKLSQSLAALQASRREAAARLRDLSAAAPVGGEGSPAGRSAAAKAQARAESAMAAAERLGEKFSGVTAGERNVPAGDLEDLAELHRRSLIRERLASHKARLAGKD